MQVIFYRGFIDPVWPFLLCSIVCWYVRFQSQQSEAIGADTKMSSEAHERNILEDPLKTKRVSSDLSPRRRVTAASSAARAHAFFFKTTAKGAYRRL